MSHKNLSKFKSAVKDENLQNELMDWTSKQGRILTANGTAPNLYTAERGFPFSETELPHYYLTNDSTHDTFSKWAKEYNEEQKLQTMKDKNSNSNPVCGAWSRPLFIGQWEHSTGEQETVYNIQSNTLFIDLRIPREAAQLLLPKVTPVSFSVSYSHNKRTLEQIMDSWTMQEICLYARRHVFGGFTRLSWVEQGPSSRLEESLDGMTSSTSEKGRRPVCTRHHCIDWNYMGKPRNRPNKWFVEMHPFHNNEWKEWSFATDHYGQHYYWEKWERLEEDGCSTSMKSATKPTSHNEEKVRVSREQENIILVLRKRVTKDDPRDGILIIVGNHFNYLFDKDLSDIDERKYDTTSSLMEVIDQATEATDREAAKAYLSIDAGHGTISSGWNIDCAIQFWKEGSALLSSNETICIDGRDLNDCIITWNGCPWDIYETSLTKLNDLRVLLSQSKKKPRRSI
jgi:hypothetical protein